MEIAHYLDFSEEPQSQLIKVYPAKEGAPLVKKPYLSMYDLPEVVDEYVAKESEMLET